MVGIELLTYVFNLYINKVLKSSYYTYNKKITLLIFYNNWKDIFNKLFRISRSGSKFLMNYMSKPYQKDTSKIYHFSIKKGLVLQIQITIQM